MTPRLPIRREYPGQPIIPPCIAIALAARPGRILPIAVAVAWDRMGRASR